MIRHVVGNPDPKIAMLTQLGFILRSVLHRIAGPGDMVTAGGALLMQDEQAISDGESKLESLFAIETNFMHQCAGYV